MTKGREKLSRLRVFFFERPFLVGAIFSLALTLFILRIFILSPGLAEWCDVEYPYEIANLFTRFNAWDPFISQSSTYNLYQYVIWLLFLPISYSGAFFEKLLYFVMYFFAGFSMFIVTFKETKPYKLTFVSSYWAAAIGSFIYLMSSLLIVKVGGGAQGLASYSFAPFVFFFSQKAIEIDQWRKLIRFALLLAIFQAFSFSLCFEFIPNFVLMLAGALLGILCRPKGRRLRGVLQGFSMASFSLLVSIGLCSFFLMPFLLSSEHAQFGYGPVGHFFANQIMNVPLDQALRLYPSHQNALMFIEKVFPASATVFWQWWSVATFIAPVLALLTPIALIRILGKKSQLTLKLFFVEFLAMFTALLACGTSSIFGDLYASLVITLPFGWLLRYGVVWLTLTSFCYAFLCGILLGVCYKRKLRLFVGSFESRLSIPKHSVSLGSLLIVLIILGSSTSSLSLLTGDVGGILRPAEIPQVYLDVRNWLSSQDGWFRVLWLPTYEQLDWMPSAHPVSGWLSPVPIASERLSTQAWFVGYAVYYAPQVNRRFMGQLLGLFSVRFIVFHHGTTIDSAQLSTLREQENLKQVYNNSEFVIFENEDFMPHVWEAPYKNSVLYYGSLEGLGRLAVGDLNLDPARNPIIIFGEDQIGLLKEALNELPTFTLWLRDKTFTDVLLSSLSPQFLYAPSDFLGYCAENMKWNLIPSGSSNILNLGSDVTYQKGVVSGGQVFLLPFLSQTSGIYSIWVRVPSRPQSFEVVVDGQNLRNVTIDSTGSEYRWINVTTVDLVSGNHRIEILNHANAYINLVAAVPMEILTSQRDSLFTQLARHATAVVYIGDNQFLEREAETLHYTTSLRTVYEEDFANYTLGVIDSTEWKTRGGTWKIQQSDGLHILSQTDSSVSFVNATSSYDLPTNAQIELDMRYEGWAFSTFLYTSANLTDFYSIHYTSQWDALQIWRYRNGAWELLADTKREYPTFKLESGQWYKLAIRLVGNELEVFINGTQVVKTQDPSPLYFIQGKLGFSTEECQFSVSNIAVKSIEQVFDVTVPMSSDYVVTIQKVGRLAGGRIDGYPLRFNTEQPESNWTISEPFPLKEGTHELAIPAGGGSEIAISTASANAITKDLYEHPNEVTYQEMNPSRFFVKRHMNNSVVVFSESYDPLWKAYFGSYETRSLPMWGQVNGFLLNATAGSMMIEFSPQRQFELGLSTSLITATLTLVYLFLDIATSRKKNENKLRRILAGCKSTLSRRCLRGTAQ